MQTVYSLLAVPAWLSENGKQIALAVVTVVAVVAFIVGFAKGFTRLGWGALFWAGACALFYALEKNFHDKNPVLRMKVVSKLDPGVQNFASTLSIALVGVLAALLVYGVFAIIFRPKKRRRAYWYANDEEVEDVEEEDLDEDEVLDSKMRHGKTRISGINRFFGGLIAAANAAIVLSAIACVLLVAFNVTPLRYGSLKSVYESDFVEKCWQYVRIYTLDFLFIAVIAAFAFCGYRTGILGGCRALLVTVGLVAAAVLAFWLPFSKFVAEKEWLAFVGKMSDYFGGLFGEKFSEKTADILGKVISGFVLCVGFCIVVGIVGFLLKLLSEAVKNVAALRVADGILSAVAALALGVVVCALIGAVLYVLEYFGIFESSALFDPASSFTRGLFDAFDEYLRPFLERLSEIVS